VLLPHQYWLQAVLQDLPRVPVQALQQVVQQAQQQALEREKQAQQLPLSSSIQRML
jgi:hypothetical protein